MGHHPVQEVDLHRMEPCDFVQATSMRSGTSSAVNKCRGKKERKKLSKDANGPVL
jgi:hypothetical protein